jgi:type VI secretion system protein VasG
MGSPPGYVGYGEGGILTEAVRRKPYSVILLDEMEKAHPGVQDVFYQVFDKGMMTDGEGRDIDFRNTVIIMTSNAGTGLISRLCADPDAMPGPEELTEALRPELMKHFRPAFLGRTTIVPYFPLPPGIMRRIVTMQLDRIGRRVQENHRAQFSYDPSVVDVIAERCTEDSVGARNVEAILSRTLLPELSAQILGRTAEGLAFEEVTVVTDQSGGFAYTLR